MRAILSGFKTKEEVKKFLEWFEGQGEQDEGIQICMNNAGVTCDVQTGMIEHEDGYEYKLRIHEK